MILQEVTCDVISAFCDYTNGVCLAQNAMQTFELAPDWPDQVQIAVLQTAVLQIKCGKALLNDTIHELRLQKKCFQGPHSQRDR